MREETKKQTEERKLTEEIPSGMGGMSFFMIWMMAACTMDWEKKSVFIKQDEEKNRNKLVTMLAN